MRTEVAGGIRHVLAHAWLRPIALSIALGYLFGTIADSILILHLVSERHVDPALIGLAFTLGSIGVIAGSLVTAPLTRVLGVGPTIILSAVGEAVAWIPIAVAPDPWLVPALTTTIVTLSFFGVAWNVNAVSLRQAITPAAMQGRVNATMRFIAWSTIPVASVLGGVLGSVIGLHATIWVGAIGSLTTALPVVLSSLGRVREMPRAAEDGLPGAARYASAFAAPGAVAAVGSSTIPRGGCPPILVTLASETTLRGGWRSIEGVSAPTGPSPAVSGGVHHGRW